MWHNDQVLILTTMHPALPVVASVFRLVAHPEKMSVAKKRLEMPDTHIYILPN